MQAQQADGRGLAAQGRVLGNQGHGLVAGAGPGRLHVQRHQLVAQQPIFGFLGEGGQVQRRAGGKAAFGAHTVDTGQKATHPLQHLAIVQLRGASTAARAHAEVKASEGVQRGTLQMHRPNDGYLGVHQLLGEGVLFQNLISAPALRPVKLGHYAATVF